MTQKGAQPALTTHTDPQPVLNSHKKQIQSQTATSIANKQNYK